MQFMTFVNAVALALFAAGAHAKVPSGTYTIINKVPSSGGPRAITFNGERETVTVSFADPSASKQQWIVQDFDETTQSISPVDADDLQCAWGEDVVTVLPANKYVWIITQNGDKSYTIQDSDETVYWGLGSTDVDTDVTIGDKTETGEQSWYFVPALIA